MKISVLSTFYNDREMLKIMMDSVLSQDYDDIEHVITDGGSTDGSVELIREYEALYQKAGKKLVWRSERDKGLYDGFNKAAGLASGALLLFGTDPYCSSTDVSVLVNKVLRSELDYAYGGMLFQKDGVIIRTWSGKPGNWRLGWMAATPTLCFKHELWEKYGPFDDSYKSAADYKFQIRLFMDKTLKSASVPVPLVNYYAGGTSNNGIKANLLSIKENFRIMKECKVRFGWFTVLCKIFIAVCAYTFSSRKKINLEEQP